jgi:hypothetical protein
MTVSYLPIPTIAPPLLLDTSLTNLARRRLNLARAARAILSEHWAEPRIERTLAVFDIAGFTKRWWQRQAMALIRSDLDALARASTLLEAVERLAPGALVECRIRADDIVWAVWVDTDRRLPIAARTVNL